MGQTLRQEGRKQLSNFGSRLNAFNKTMHHAQELEHESSTIFEIRLRISAIDNKKSSDSEHSSIDDQSIDSARTLNCSTNEQNKKDR